MDNITVTNNDISSSDPTGFFGAMNGGRIELSNITIKNSDIGVKHVFEYHQSSTGTIKIQDVYVDNVTLGTDTKIFKTQSLTSFEMRNSTYSSVHPSDSSDSSPKLTKLGSIALADQLHYVIMDTHIEQSTLPLIGLSNIESSIVLSASFTVSNLTYVDSYFQFSQDLVSFTNIETSNNFSITLNNLNMQNITFFRTGNLMVLSHQTNSTLEISNVYFKNINGAQILTQSTNLQNTNLLTKVRMDSVTASSMSGASNSFTTINEGGVLHLSDSSFTHIDNTERGAVLNAGYQNSQTEIHNSTFTENTSIYGGVANVQDGSVIRFYDCNLTSNFAIQSRVIQSSNDGYFELYRSYITNNHAYTISVSEIFIVDQPSIISNSSLSSNTILSRSDILTEFETCGLIRFVSDVFVNYIKSSINLLDFGSIDYSIQCFSGAIAIMNNTFISNQLTFIDEYLSELSMDKSAKYTITTSKIIVNVISSNLTINDCMFIGIHTNQSSQILDISFETNAVLINVFATNSSTKFVESLPLLVQMTNVRVTNIPVSNHLIGFINCYEVIMQDLYVDTVQI